VRRSRRTQRDSAAVITAAVRLQKVVRGWLVRSRLQGRRVTRSATQQQQQQQQQQRLADGNWRRAPVRSLSASEASSSATALPRAVSRENASEGGSLDLVRVGVLSASAAAAAAAGSGTTGASSSSSSSPRHSVHTAAQRSGDWLLSPLPPVPRRSSSTSPHHSTSHQQYQQQQQSPSQQPFDLNAGACLLSAIRRKLHSPVAELPGPRSRGASPPREPLNAERVMWSCVRQPEGLLWWRKHALVLQSLELGSEDLLPVLQASTAAGLHVKSLQLSGNRTEGTGLGQWLQVR
jgi:IQ calmodulin-binding motif